MNNQYIQEAKQQITKNLKCESCWWWFSQENIWIKSIWWNQSIIEAKCKNCWTVMQLQAEIMEQEDMEKVMKNEISDWKMKVLEDWKAVNYKNSNYSKEFEEIKKQEDIQKSVITSTEIWSLSKKLSNFSSFKNLFSLVLFFWFFMPIIFSWCADTAEENRQNILNWIESAKNNFNNAKDQAENIYINWKEVFDQAQEIIKQAPAKIEETKANIEKMKNDAIKLKADLDKKVADTKNAIDQTKKAVDAVSGAMNSISAISWNLEVSTWWIITWTGENK